MGMIIMNGKEYASSPKDGFPPIIYSDEEREVGVWRDGKPLYQITKNIGALNSDGYWHRIAHNVSNIDKIINVNGMARVQDTDMDFLPIPNYRPASSYGIVLGIDETNISYIDNWIAGELYTYVTFQYTKTTDVPGSGKYTTYGGLSHHYSTTEQVVGTWTDGKTLYEKTYSGLNITCTSGTYTHSNIVESNFNKIISVVSATDGYNQTPCLSVGLFSGNELALYVVSPTCVLTSFTLRYTKTTD